MPVTLSNLISSQAAWNLNAVNARLGESILRLSSGLRVQRPSDGTIEFIRGQSLESGIRQYQGIKNSLSEYKAVLTLANDAAAEIRGKLESMKEKATAASGETDFSPGSVGATLFEEFNDLRQGIDNIVKSTKYEGGGILNSAGQYNQPLSITITPDRSVTMDIDLDNLDVSTAGPGGLVIDDTAWAGAADASASMTEIDTALSTVDTFLSETGSYINELDSHGRITDSLIENYGAARSALVEVDVAEEMANYTALDVTRQAATAILAQANLSHRSLLNLYEFKYS